MKYKDRVIIDDTPVAEQAPAVVLTREQIESNIAYLQWRISRNEVFVAEHHVELENLYGLRDKMDALENE